MPSWQRKELNAMKKLSYALLALALACGIAGAWPLPGEPAPNFSLPDSAGQYHSLSDYLGKAVMLNFWQSG
jgi:hypothetical protein